MGTYGIPGTGHMSVIDFLKQEIECERHRIIDHSIKGNVAYLAIRFLNKSGQTEVYGLVCQLSKDGDMRYYKPVEESMGPYEIDCPLRILNKLSPTDSECANKWREACRERASKTKRPCIGQTIKLSTPLKFSDGYVGDTFTVTTAYSKGRQVTCYRAPSGQCYRITRIEHREFEVLNSVTA